MWRPDILDSGKPARAARTGTRLTGCLGIACYSSSFLQSSIPPYVDKIARRLGIALSSWFPDSANAAPNPTHLLQQGPVQLQQRAFSVSVPRPVCPALMKGRSAQWLAELLGKRGMFKSVSQYVRYSSAWGAECACIGYD
jgi:hypothetical protein